MRMMKFTEYHEEYGFKFGISQHAVNCLNEAMSHNRQISVNSMLKIIAKNCAQHLDEFTRAINEQHADIDDKVPLPTWVYQPGGVNLRIVGFIDKGQSCIGIVHNDELKPDSAQDGQTLFRGFR